MNRNNLATAAVAAREKSYSPYSGFKVGASLMSKSGRLYTGCNIENAAYSPTNCAERSAFFNAVSEGEREFIAIAIAGGYDGDLEYCYPCGVCLQVMMEFTNPDEFTVIIVKSESDYKEYKLSELLPYGFGRGDLRKDK